MWLNIVKNPFKWIKELFTSKPKPDAKIIMSAAEYDLMKSQAQSFKENKKLIEEQERKKLAEKLGCDQNNPKDNVALDMITELTNKVKASDITTAQSIEAISKKNAEDIAASNKKHAEDIEKLNKRNEESDKKHAEDIQVLKDANTESLRMHKEVCEKILKLESTCSESLNKLVTMTDVALQLQRDATYTKKYTLSIIDNAIQMNKKYSNSGLESQDKLLESYNRIISEIESKIVILKEKSSNLTRESSALFSDKDKIFKQIDGVNVQIRKEEQELGKYNRLINKALSDKGVIESDAKRYNDYLLQARDEIDRIEIISKDEIIRILDDVVKLNRDNGVNVPNSIDLVSDFRRHNQAQAIQVNS